MTTAAQLDDQIADDLAGFTHDPLGWVRWAFPWGEGELRDEAGPRQWQADILTEIGARLAAGDGGAIQTAVSSGHGIGKSALLSWIKLWALSTMEDTRGVVTANTQAQLTTKTWPEVAKWHRLCLCSHWFTFTATSLFSADPKHEKTWRIDAIPWNERAPEAFAGLHNKGKRILVIFDEASAIPDTIWETVEGALTDERTEILWPVFGNPTRNAGRFHACFNRLGHRWHHRQIDSRDVPGTNRAQIDKWVADYGEDSDFVRVRVRGLFPQAGSMQFIPSSIIELARTIEPVVTIYDPVILGVDVARYGEDESVIVERRGRDARTWPMQTFRGVDTMTLAGKVAEIARKDNADAIFVDETGIGGAVVDRLRQLGWRCIGVNNGAVSDVPVEGELVANKGAECWARMRQWLKSGGALCLDDELRLQLEGREYGYNVHNQIRLESKDDMRKRGLASPDRADALALTFAYPVAAKSDPARQAAAQSITDFDPYAVR